MQRTWVQSLVWEDSTCCGATKPVLLTPEPAHLGPALCNQTAHRSEKPIPRDKATKRSACWSSKRKLVSSNEDPAQPKINK